MANQPTKSTSLIYWIYLLIAAFMEIFWLYSLKFISKDKIMAIVWKDFFSSTEPIMTLLPVLGYIGFGIANVIAISMAMKGIPASTAFGAWMGLALIGSKLIDITFFDEPYTIKQFLFIGLILIGIIGLKIETP